jgi:hypothetical protein
VRELSELTYQEGVALWNLIMPSYAVPFDTLLGSAYNLQSVGDTPNRFMFTQAVERLGIYHTGRVWADSDLEPIKLDGGKIREYLTSIGITTEITHS